jgi:hypothetical protein
MCVFQIDCASTGGLIYAPKTSPEHDLLTRFAKSFINANMWVGVTIGIVTTAYNNTHDPAVQPLIVSENATVWSYADGSPFDTTTDYRFNLPGTSAAAGPCMYLKMSAGYSGRELGCDNTFAFICKWRGEECS